LILISSFSGLKLSGVNTEVLNLLETLFPGSSDKCWITHNLDQKYPFIGDLKQQYVHEKNMGS
jgi:hypothetical protein